MLAGVHGFWVDRSSECFAMKLRLGTDALRRTGGPGNNETATFKTERRRFSFLTNLRSLLASMEPGILPITGEQNYNPCLD